MRLNTLNEFKGSGWHRGFSIAIKTRTSKGGGDMKWNLETYKCGVLTVIAILLAAILWQMPAKPLTFGQMRTARTNGVPMKDILSRVPLVYLHGGSITVDNLENPMPVEVENTVEAEIAH
jgi:hypothetical protein